MAYKLNDLALKWINYENRLINDIKLNIRTAYKNFPSIPQDIEDILKETNRDVFFTKYLNFYNQNAEVMVSVSGSQRRRINVKVGNKKLDVPQYIWNEINSYNPPLTLPQDRDKLLGYAWEIAGEYIIDESLKRLSNQKELNQLVQGIRKVPTLNGYKQNISVDYSYEINNEVDRNNIKSSALNIDSKSNLYNFHIGDIYLDDFNRIISINYSQDYQNLIDYIVTHIITTKYGNQHVVFYSPSGTKRAITLGSVLSDVGNLHLKNQLSNNDIIKEASNIYFNNKEYYDSIGVKGEDFITFWIEGRKQKMSSELEKEILKQAADTASKQIATSLWYGKK